MVAECAQDTRVPRLIAAAAQWIADGWSVYPRLLYYRDDKLTKSSFALCPACKERKAQGVSPAECGCSCLLCHGQHKATLELQRFALQALEAVKRCGAGASVGLGVVVPDGGLVLDVDRHEGGDDGLTALAELDLLGCDGRGETVRTEPETRMCITVSNGLHLYYSMPPGSPLPKSGRLKVKGSTALEVKRPGDYLVVPPSYDPRSGARYWEHFDDLGAPMAAIQPAPQRLLDLLAAVDRAERPAEAVTFRQPARGYEHRSRRFPDPFTEVLQRLDDLGKRKRKEGSSWLYQCPAHDDRNPSLSVTSTPTGVRLKCFSGCDTAAICRALELKVADLFTTERASR